MPGNWEDLTHIFRNQLAKALGVGRDWPPFVLGFPDQALARTSAAITETRRLAHPASLALTLTTGTKLLSLVGDNAALEEQADELVAVATEQGFPLWRALGTIYRGCVKVNDGDVAEGIAPT